MCCKPIKYVSSRRVYEDPWMILRVDQIELSDGSKSEYGIVERASFVLILVVQSNQMLLVRQYRYPVDSWSWEFPQGACDSGESIEDAAKRELLEETGYVAGCIETFSILYEAAGFATHCFYVVKAEISGISKPLPEVSEHGIVCRWIPMVELKKMILNGELKDAASLAALSVYLLKQ